MAKPPVKAPPEKIEGHGHRIDWDSVRVIYSFGSRTNAQIAKFFGTQLKVLEGKISRENQEAERLGLPLPWVRNNHHRLIALHEEKLLEKSKVVEPGVNHDLTPSQYEALQDKVIDKAADELANVVISHRGYLKKLGATVAFMHECAHGYLNGHPVMIVNDEGETVEAKFLGPRENISDFMDKVSKMGSRWVQLERQSHRLDEAKDVNALEGVLGKDDENV